MAIVWELRTAGQTVATAKNGEEYKPMYNAFLRMARKKQDATIVIVQYDGDVAVRSTIFRKYRSRK